MEIGTSKDREANIDDNIPGVNARELVKVQ